VFYRFDTGQQFLPYTKYRLPLYFLSEDQFPSAVDTCWQWRHPQAYSDVSLASTFLWNLLPHFVGIKFTALCVRTAAVRWNFTSCVISLCYSCMQTNQPTSCSTVLPQKLTVPQLVKKFPHFMETKELLPRSQLPATCPYPEPDKSMSKKNRRLDFLL